MKNSHIKHTCGYTVAVVLAVILSVVSSAHCQTDGVAMLLQQTPAEGGRVTPGPGMHHFETDAEIALTAVPAAGYQFVYWLGDVSDPGANSTIARLDAPKIIIAVFQKIEYDFLPFTQQMRGAPLGGARASAADYQRGGISPTAGTRPRSSSWPRPPQPPQEEPEEPDQPEFPVPNEGDNFPVPEPVPEPGTLCLFGLGGLIFLRKRRRKSP